MSQDLDSHAVPRNVMALLVRAALPSLVAGLAAAADPLEALRTE